MVRYDHLKENELLVPESTAIVSYRVFYSFSASTSERLGGVDDVDMATKKSMTA